MYALKPLGGARGGGGLLHNPCVLGGPRKEDKIRNGFITLPLQSSFMVRDGKKWGRGDGSTPRPLLTNGGGGAGGPSGAASGPGSPPTHPPKLTHPPTHPDPPLPGYLVKLSTRRGKTE